MGPIASDGAARTEEAADDRKTDPGRPPHRHTWIISRDTAGLIDHLKEAFDAEETARVVGEDGRMGHAEVRIGDCVVMPFDAPSDWPPASTVEDADADAAHRRAVASGGTSVTEVTHLFFGDRIGRVRAPLGNLWWLWTRVENVSPEELERRLGDRTGSRRWRTSRAPTSSRAPLTQRHDRPRAPRRLAVAPR